MGAHSNIQDPSDQNPDNMKNFPTFSFLMVAFFSGAYAEENSPATSGDHSLIPGLLVTYEDDTGSASEGVMLPELGLEADESPHPAIKPAFTATFEGFLQVTQAGRYQFDTSGTLMIDGETVSGDIDLEAGQHPLRLTFRRGPGDLTRSRARFRCR